MEQIQKHRNHNDEKSPLLVSLIGGGIGLATTVLLALLMPFALLSMGDPNAMSALFAAVCVFIGGAAGSAVTSKLFGEASVLSGLLSGIVMLVPMILASFIVPGEYDIVLFAIMAVSVLASSVITSLLTAKITYRRKNDMKKMMKRR